MNLQIEELNAIQNRYNSIEIKDKTTKTLHKSITKQAIKEAIEKEIDKEKNSPRLQQYLEKTKICEIEFLHQNLSYRGNNLNGILTPSNLLFQNKETCEILKDYNITTLNKLREILYLIKVHPILKNETIIEFLQNAKYLAFLDKFFQNIDNCLAYQGSFITYSYVKSFLKKVLASEEHIANNTLIYQDYDKKIKLVTENLTDIASSLLEYRERFPNSRLAIYNQGLRKIINKESNSPLSFNQKIFIEALAYGTTFEKLESKNYEDAKKLIYIPHQKIV